MLFDENDRQLLVKIAIGVLGVMLLVALLFAAPFLMYQKVPLVSTQVADMYVNAAQAARQSTQTPPDPQGVAVNWQQVLAVDAVRYNGEALYQADWHTFSYHRIGQQRHNCYVSGLPGCEPARRLQ